MLKICLVFFVAAAGIDVSNSGQIPWGSQVTKAPSQRYTRTGSNIISSKAVLQPSYFHLRSKSSPADLENAANYIVRPNAPSIASTSRPTSSQPDCPVLCTAVEQFFATIRFITKWETNLHSQFLDCLRDGNRLCKSETNINICAPKVYDESGIHGVLKSLKASNVPGMKEDICNAAKTYHSQTYAFKDRHPLGGYLLTLLFNCPGVQQTTFTIPRVASNADDSNAPSPEPMRVGPNQVEIRNVSSYLNFQEFVRNYEPNDTRITTQSRGGSGCVPRGCSIQ